MSGRPDVMMTDDARRIRSAMQLPIEVAIVGSMKHQVAIASMAEKLKLPLWRPVLPSFHKPGANSEQFSRELWESVSKATIVLVVNPDGYVGASTFAAIALARFLNKPVFVVQPVSESSVGYDELKVWELHTWS